MNINTQENWFKILLRWYRTPTKLHKISPTLSPLCWWYGGERGSLLHIWWTCPLIQPFWKEVHWLTNHQLPPSLWNTHQHNICYIIPQFPKSTYLRSLAMNLLNEARLCIPTGWRSTSSLTTADWLKRIQKNAGMEELVHLARDTPSKFRKTWSCWQHFTITEEFTNLMT